MELVASPIATRHAVIVRDEARVGLLCEVRCLQRSSIVVLVPRKDEEFGYPHTTYHVDGTCHMRSLGAKMVEERGLPRLDRPFQRAVNVVALTSRSRDAKLAWPPRDRLSDYSGVVEVPASAFDRSQVIISVDIVRSRKAAPAHYQSEKVMEQDLYDTVPPVRITIWKPRA